MFNFSLKNKMLLLAVLPEDSARRLVEGLRTRGVAGGALRIQRLLVECLLRLADVGTLAAAAAAMIGMLIPSTTLTLLITRWAHRNHELRLLRSVRIQSLPTVVLPKNVVMILRRFLTGMMRRWRKKKMKMLRFIIWTLPLLPTVSVLMPMPMDKNS